MDLAIHQQQALVVTAELSSIPIMTPLMLNLVLLFHWLTSWPEFVLPLSACAFAYAYQAWQLRSRQRTVEASVLVTLLGLVFSPWEYLALVASVAMGGYATAITLRPDMAPPPEKPRRKTMRTRDYNSGITAKRMLEETRHMEEAGPAVPEASRPALPIPAPTSQHIPEPVNTPRAPEIDTAAELARSQPAQPERITKNVRWADRNTSAGHSEDPAAETPREDSGVTDPVNSKAGSQDKSEEAESEETQPSPGETQASASETQINASTEIAEDPAAETSHEESSVTDPVDNKAGNQDEEDVQTGETEVPISSTQTTTGTGIAEDSAAEVPCEVPGVTCPGESKVGSQDQDVTKGKEIQVAPVEQDLSVATEPITVRALTQPEAHEHDVDMGEASELSATEVTTEVPVKEAVTDDMDLAINEAPVKSTDEVMGEAPPIPQEEPSSFIPQTAPQLASDAGQGLPQDDAMDLARDEPSKKPSYGLQQGTPHIPFPQASQAPLRLPQQQAQQLPPSNVVHIGQVPPQPQGLQYPQEVPQQSPSVPQPAITSMPAFPQQQLQNRPMIQFLGTSNSAANSPGTLLPPRQIKPVRQNATLDLSTPTTTFQTNLAQFMAEQTRKDAERGLEQIRKEAEQARKEAELAAEKAREDMENGTMQDLNAAKPETKEEKYARKKAGGQAAWARMVAPRYPVGRPVGSETSLNAQGTQEQNDVQAQQMHVDKGKQVAKTQEEDIGLEEGLMNLDGPDSTEDKSKISAEENPTTTSTPASQGRIKRNGLRSGIPDDDKPIFDDDEEFAKMEKVIEEAGRQGSRSSQTTRPGAARSESIVEPQTRTDGDATGVDHEMSSVEQHMIAEPTPAISSEADQNGPSSSTDRRTQDQLPNQSNTSADQHMQDQSSSQSSTSTDQRTQQQPSDNDDLDDEPVEEDSAITQEYQRRLADDIQSDPTHPLHHLFLNQSIYPPSAPTESAFRPSRPPNPSQGPTRSPASERPETATTIDPTSLRQLREHTSGYIRGRVSQQAFEPTPVHSVTQLNPPNTRSVETNHPYGEQPLSFQGSATEHEVRYARRPGQEERIKSPEPEQNVPVDTSHRRKKRPTGTRGARAGIAQQPQATGYNAQASTIDPALLNQPIIPPPSPYQPDFSADHLNFSADQSLDPKPLADGTPVTEKTFEQWMIENSGPLTSNIGNNTASGSYNAPLNTTVPNPYSPSDPTQGYGQSTFTAQILTLPSENSYGLGQTQQLPYWTGVGQPEYTTQLNASDQQSGQEDGQQDTSRSGQQGSQQDTQQISQRNG
ncbi:Hypothetical protein D9617_8g050150 [Elsinoe fawcettii]|nr:Hypothetical protein D9617_8g050150 [Elsinoe fawcettii]